MKLKDYVIPPYGAGDGLGQEDLEQYSLKNFDLKAFQLAQQQPDPDPIPVACAPAPLAPEPVSPSPVATEQAAPPPNQVDANGWSSTPQQPSEPSFEYAPNPVQTQGALQPFDVHFGAHFDLQQPIYIPPSPSQSWKMPRWVITMVGLFFGSAAVMALAVCVVLLRDPKPAPTEQAAVPPAPVATTTPTTTAAAPAPSAPVHETTTTRAPVRAAVPATASLIHDDSALPHRTVVSRHPSVVRRRVASTSASSAVEPQETETASRRAPQDALDKLLSESSL